MDYNNLFKEAKTHNEARMIFHSNVTKDLSNEQKEMLFEAYQRAKKEIPDEEKMLIDAGKFS